jgi:hypothetical protein
VNQPGLLVGPVLVSDAQGMSLLADDDRRMLARLEVEWLRI